MKNIFLVIVGIVSMAILSGCNKAPEGFPKVVVPCTVTVTDAGKPIPEATVNFISDSVTSGLTVGGITDASGKATIATQHGEYKKVGAPQGNFKIVVSTPLSVDMPNMTAEERYSLTKQQLDEIEQERQAKIDAIRIIPKDLSSPAKTPLKLDISSGPATLDIDISQYK